MRRYKHGSAWAVWRYTDVDWKGRTYLLRLHLLKTPWFAIMLHWIKGPDPHPDPHDHPVSFLSITVRGGYEERLFDALTCRCGDSYLAETAPSSDRVRYRRARDVHQITAAEPDTLTLVFAGPVERRWGYHTPEGWVDWKAYREEHAR